MFNYFLEWRSEDRVAQRFKRKWQVQLLQVFCMLSIMIMNTQNVEAGPYDPIAATQTKWYVSGFTTTRRDDPETACADVNKTNLGFWCGKFWGASLNFIGVYNGTCYNFRAGYNPTTMLGTYRGWLCPYDYTDTQGKLYSNFSALPLAIEPTCPANSYPMNSEDQNQVGQCRCTYPLVADTTGTSCVVQCPIGQQPDATGLACVPFPPCPAQASGTAPNCTCNAGFQWDAAHTSCVVASACPGVPDVPPIPATDLCALSLEKGNGKDVDGKCTAISPALDKELTCFAQKIGVTSISYSKPTATFRSPAYQTHLRDIWDALKKLNREKNPATKAACQPLQSKLQAHLSVHGVTDQPGKTSNHSAGWAFDVPNDTINTLIQVMTGTAPDKKNDSLQTLQLQRQGIATWLGSPPPCGLKWGGEFNNPPDFVHFQLP